MVMLPVIMRYEMLKKKFNYSYLYVLDNLLPELPHSSLPGDLALPLNLTQLDTFD